MHTVPQQHPAYEICEVDELPEHGTPVGQFAKIDESLGIIWIAYDGDKAAFHDIKHRALAAAERPSEIYLIVIRSDASWELYVPNGNPDGSGVDPSGPWIQSRFRPGGRFRAAAPPLILEEHVIVLRVFDIGWELEAEILAAAHALELSGQYEILRLYNRRHDGRFACPHCGKRYIYPLPFANHLERQCDDRGGERFLANRTRPHGSVIGPAAE